LPLKRKEQGKLKSVRNGCRSHEKRGQSTTLKKKETLLGEGKKTTRKGNYLNVSCCVPLICKTGGEGELTFSAKEGGASASLQEKKALQPDSPGGGFT